MECIYIHRTHGLKKVGQGENSRSLDKIFRVAIQHAYRHE